MEHLWACTRAFTWNLHSQAKTPHLAARGFLRRRKGERILLDINWQGMASSYLRWWTATDNLMLAVFLTPQMSQTFAVSTFAQADVTFPGCQVLKYLLNVVTFNELTMKWQVVAMSRTTTSAYFWQKTNVNYNLTKLNLGLERSKIYLRITNGIWGTWLLSCIVLFLNVYNLTLTRLTCNNQMGYIWITMGRKFLQGVCIYFFLKNFTQSHQLKPIQGFQKN